MALKITEKKFYRYLYLRLIRQRGTPHDIALGVSIGLFSGMVVPVFQIFLALLVAWIFRVNKFMAFTCTWISNPLTFPFIIPLNIYVGSWFINSNFEAEKLENITFTSLFTNFKEVLLFFVSDGMLMYMIGGAFFGLICGIIAYPYVYRIVDKKQKLRLEKANERFNDMQSRKEQE